MGSMLVLGGLGSIQSYFLLYIFLEGAQMFIFDRLIRWDRYKTAVEFEPLIGMEVSKYATTWFRMLMLEEVNTAKTTYHTSNWRP